MEPRRNGKITLIEESLRCLRLGWLALIPGIGFAFALAGLRRYCRALFFVEDDWNPARLQLDSGAFLALVSLLVHSLGVTALIWGLLHPL